MIEKQSRGTNNDKEDEDDVPPLVDGNFDQQPASNSKAKEEQAAPNSKAKGEPDKTAAGNSKAKGKPEKSDAGQSLEEPVM